MLHFSGRRGGTEAKIRSRRSLNLVAAVIVAGLLLYLMAAGTGSIPAMGPLLNPGTGAWTAARDARLTASESLRLPTLHQPVRVAFDSIGVAYIEAADDRDVFVAQGYLHARYRLFQMDLQRRFGEGRLAEVLGPSALDHDRFELQLGLTRTADAEWAQLPADDPARTALEAYAEGVNARIREAVAGHDLPILFKTLGYQPGLWRPQDSLAVQGDETQSLDFQTGPLDYALLVKSLGLDRTMSWLPVLPPDQQHPYAPGPYAARAQPEPLPGSGQVSEAEAHAAAALRNRIAAMPFPTAQHEPASNNWAVDGSKSSTGKPLLAGDPHLDLTLPSIWYQVSAKSPGLEFAGVGIPGTPGIIIGRNRHISWSLTDTQAQATLYYSEKTDRAHPGQYFWKGSWRNLQTIDYEIPVHGAPTDHFKVELTVHGPVMTIEQQTLSVDWMGALPSNDLGALLGVVRASDFAGFKAALKAWHAPTHNFIYADDAGHIGLIAPGYYPQVGTGNPWLPLPGTGESDITGTIPYDAVPQVYDPPSHFLFSANQRPVAADYPYYIGTVHVDFANGYRANRIFSMLSQDRRFSADDMKRLQNDRGDYLATLMVPKLLEALRGTKLTDQQQRARDYLAAWDASMDTGSQAAAIWWNFWQAYLSETFQPWWAEFKVPVPRGDLQDPLSQVLETWTLSDPQNATFTPPGAATRSAPDVMVRAFADALDGLNRQLGTDPAGWQWGRLHSRKIESLAQIDSLAYGPVPAGGDAWTLNVSRGEPSTSGPSWRFVMDWAVGQGYGSVPGGQDENPVSNWYQNRVGTWLKGGYDSVLDPGRPVRNPSATWDLRP